MKRTTRRGRRLTLVSFTAVLAALAPIPAFAEEGPLVTVPTTVDAAGAASTIVDEVSGAVTSTVDTVPDPTGTVVDVVTDAADTTVDPVSNAASGAVGSITDAVSDVGGSGASSAGSLVGAVTDATSIGDADPGTGSATARPSGGDGGSSTHAVTSSDSTVGVSQLRSSSERRPLTLAVGAEGPSRATLGTDRCADAGGPSCSPASGTAEEDSLAEKIAEVIGQLAVTGSLLLPWIAAALVLIVLGSVALERSRSTGSRARA